MPHPPKKIAVLGAGITGLMSAYALAQDGNALTIYDPAGFESFSNASAKAGGMLAPYSEIEHMPRAWIDAARHSVALWADILPQETGFRRGGSLLIAHGPDRYMLERFKSHLQSHDPSCFETVAPEAIEPALPEGTFASALLLPEEASLLPLQTMRALLAGTKAEKFRQGPEPQALGNEYDLIVDCRGMGAAHTDKNLRGVKGELAIVRNPEFALSRPLRLMHPRYPLYIVPRPHHCFMIGATIIESAGDENVSVRSAMELMSALYSLHPSFGHAQLVKFEAGIRPAYTDNLPKITLETEQIMRINGLFRHGFLLAPLLAEAVRAYSAGEPDRYWNLLTHEGADDNHQSHDQRAAQKL